MSGPLGWSLATEAQRAQQWERANRLSTTTFAGNTNPMRAARATISLRNVYPWLTPNLAAKMGAFGVHADDPGVAEIAGTALARRGLRGDFGPGQRVPAATVRNVTAPRNWRDVPVSERSSLPPATVDRAIGETFGVDPAMTPTDQLARMRDAFYTGRSLADAEAFRASPSGQFYNQAPPDVPDRVRARANDVGLDDNELRLLVADTREGGGTVNDAISDYATAVRGYSPIPSGGAVPSPGGALPPVERDPLAQALGLGPRSVGGRTFATARDISEGTFDLGSFEGSNAMRLGAEQLAEQIPSLEATFQHIRRGGLTFRGIPLPGGDVSADELRDVYTGPAMDQIARTFGWKRQQLEDRYPDPGDMPASVRAVYDGIASALDDVIDPERQSFGPDLLAGGVNFNVSDLWSVPYDAAKGTIRTATMAMDTLWQGGQATFRAVLDDPGAALFGHGFSWDDRTEAAEGYYQASQETDLGVALQQLANGASIEVGPWTLRDGPQVDTGSGFYVTPQSGVGQERLRQEQTHGLIGGHAITIGRWAADTAGLEPDTLPFDIVSGTVDLAWQLVEPGGALVDVAAQSRGARTLLARAGGFVPSRSVNPERFAEFLASTDGQRVIDHFAAIDPTDDAAIMASYNTMSQAGGPSVMPRIYHDALARGELGDTAYVSELLANFTGMGYHTPGVATRGAESGLAALVAPGVAWRRRMGTSRLATLTPETSEHAMDTYDAVNMSEQAIASMRNLHGMPESEIARIVGRINSEMFELPTRVRYQQLERELDNLRFAGDHVVWRGESVPTDVARLDIEDTMAELRPGLFINRPTPRRNVARDIWLDMQQVKRDVLIAHGVEPEQADALTHLQEVGRRADTRMIDDHLDEGAFWLRRVTEEDRARGANIRPWAMVDGEHTTDLSQPGLAHMLAEHQGRYLPLEDDYRQLARLTRGPVAQWLTGTPSGAARSYVTLLDGFMSKVWKPSRLIRPAYPIRVVGEEQFRIAATGLDGAFNHPLSAVAMIFGARRDGRMARALDTVTGDHLDELGNLRTDALGTPWEAVTEFRSAMNKNQRTWIIPTGGGSSGRYEPAAYLRQPNGTFTPGYHEAMIDHYAQAHSDDLMRPLAQIALGEHSQYDTIDDLIEAGGGVFTSADEVRLGGGPLQPTGRTALEDMGSPRHPAHATIRNSRSDLMDSHPELGQRGPRTYAARFGSAGTDGTVIPVHNWDDYIESLNVRLLTLTGGDEDLLHAIARGRFPDGLTLDVPNTTRINKRAARRLEEYEDVLPDAIKGDASFYNQATGRRIDKGLDGYDHALERMFGLLGAIPTDRLSRSPAFRQFYARRMQELLPFMDPVAQRRFLDSAKELMAVPEHGWHIRLSAYIGDTDSVTSPTMASLRRAAVQGKGDLSLEAADEIAKLAALDNTRWLLYDVHSRGQFMDALRLVFPFGEAWKEVATRWLGLLARRPGTVTQRATQLVGLTGGVQPWEEVVNQPDQHGFLYTNSSGETVFTYPASEWFTTQMTGIPVQLTGSLNGLSIMSSVLPGVGPVVQVLPQMSSRFRESPEFDGIRDLLFPFGLGENPAEGLAGFSSWALDLVLSPAAQRVISGLLVAGTGNEAAMDQAMLSTWGDVMRYNVSTGRYRTDSEPAISRLANDSIRDTGLVTLLRGLAGLTLPSAPLPEFQVEGNDGQLLMLRALRDRYRQLQEEDWTTATTRFLEDYGENLGLVMQSTSVPRTTMVAVTEEADRWVREHPEVKGDYPITYGLWAPGNTNGDFDIEAWGRNVRDHTVQVLGRELTPEDFVYLANDRVASAIYRQVEEAILERRDGTLTEADQAQMRVVREDLEDRYLGFNLDGLPKGPSPDRLRQTIGEPGQDTEIRRGVDNPLFPAPLREAVRTYLEVHDTANTVWAPELGATTYYDSQGTESIRQYLRYTVAPSIRADLPERYRGQWDNFYDRLFDRIMIAPAEEATADEEAA